jgi:hypothetical protein
MDKAQLLTKTQQTLQPFETQSVIIFLKDLSMKTVTDNPKVTFLLFLIFLYALWRWSRRVLLALFSLLSLTMLIRYALPPPGTELTVNSTLPFICGCMGIASVLLYFIFIRTE